MEKNIAEVILFTNNFFEDILKIFLFIIQVIATLQIEDFLL